MSQWDYVIAVYIIALVGTAGLIALVFTGMRRAEKRFEDLKRK